MFSDRYSDALAYTHDLHRCQRRKGSNVPYVAHLLSVSALVIEEGGSEDQAIAALLHDAVEDQGGRERLDQIRSRYGEVVAEIVSDCTDSWEAEEKEPWEQRKAATLAALPAKAPRSLLVALADKTHNAESIRDDFEQIGEAVFERFSASAERTRWYYRSLSAVFSERVPGRLSERLARAVEGFDGTSGQADAR